MDRLKKYIAARDRCKMALEKDASLFPLEWVIEQLNYLIDFERGEANDLEPLKKIKIGWIAVRELDGFEDKDLIHDLCAISQEVETIISKRL